MPDSIVQGLAVIQRTSQLNPVFLENGLKFIFSQSHTEITEQRSSKIEKAATSAVSHKPALNSSAGAGATTLRSLDDLKKVRFIQYAIYLQVASTTPEGES